MPSADMMKLEVIQGGSPVKRRRKRSWLPWLLGALCAGLLIWGIAATVKAKEYRSETERLTAEAEVLRADVEGYMSSSEGYRAAVERLRSSAQTMYAKGAGELADMVYDMEISLAKLIVSGSQSRKILALQEISDFAGSAAGILAQLPTSYGEAHSLNRFLVQTGDFAHMLTQSLLKGKEISQEDVEQLKSLHEACVELAERLKASAESGDIPTESLDFDGFYSEDVQTDEELPDYPTLIYDGPFSDSTEKAEPQGLTGEDISEQEALEIAGRITGVELTSYGLTEGKIPCYDFGGATEDGREVDISITRQGGMLLWYMCSAVESIQEKPSAEEYEKCLEAGEKWLAEQSFESMTPTYEQYYDGALLISFAYDADGVTVYNDLVKVWVDRTTLNVIGADARNYIFSHTERWIPEPLLTEEEAEALVSELLTIETRRLAMIPLTPQTEVLCYEFTATYDDTTYVVYINAVNGDEEQIFIIIDDENGRSAV